MMDSREKKLAVLHQLSQEANPTSLRELLEKLGDQFAERSVRRWLGELIHEGLVEKKGQKKATQYTVIRRADRQIETVNSCFSSESEKAIEQVQRPIYERLPMTYHDHWLQEYKPNETFYIPHKSRRALLRAGQRCTHDDPAGTYAHQIFNRLLIDLSYNSSRLEGNTYSLLDTQKLLFEGTTAEGKLDIEKIMILNHKEAIRYLVDTASRLEINKQTIFTLHYLLAEGLIDAGYVGKIRDHGIRIGGSTYIPIENPMQLHLQLDKIIGKAAQIQDPFEQSFFLLVHITYLQAFADVNKRTARLSANIPLVKNNLVPLSFNDIEREGYISSVIAIYELQEIRPLLDLYIFSYMRTCAMYDATVQALGFDEIRVRYRKERRALIRTIILQCLVGNTLEEYIDSQSHLLVPANAREAFLGDVKEDLRELDCVRLVGLGVTPEDLKVWQDACAARNTEQ